MNTNNKRYLRGLFAALAMTAVISVRGAEAPTSSNAAQNQDHGAKKITQVVGGLHSPRGLAFGQGNTLYVSEAGTGTNDGAIIEIKDATALHPKVRTILSGLPSTGDPSAGEFLGPAGISVLGEGKHFTLYDIISLSPQETGNPAFGNLLKVNSHGQLQTLANVGSFLYQWTADHVSLFPTDFPDANPYGVLALRDHVYVVDAGANTLNEVMPDGSIRVLAFFPNNVNADATPTCVAQGPDGFLYVGTLALVDSVFIGPSAKVYRLDPHQANLANPENTPLTEWASGLYPINGCAFGRDGALYVSQLFTNPAHDFGVVFSDPHGDVVKIPFHSPSTHTFLTGGALSFTAGVAVGPNGAVYVADGTAYVPEGRVVRIDN